MIQIFNLIENVVSVGALVYVELAVVGIVVIMVAGAVHRSQYSTSYYSR